MKSDRSCRVSVTKVHLLVGLMCLVVCGCSGGEYKRRMDQTIGQLQEEGRRAAAVFAAPSGVVDSAGAATGISLRLPVFVDKTAKSLKATDANAQPPFCQLPGLAYSYEIPFDGVPAYVYLAAAKVGEKDAEKLAAEVQAAVKKTFSGAAWQDVTLTGFSGGDVKLKRMSVSGPQAFGSQKEEGHFDIYLVSSASHHVLIGWRASVAVDKSQGVFEKVAISMGTVTGAS